MKNRAFDHSNYENWIDPNAVTPYEKNAKIHTDKQIRNIANSIKRFGWQQDTVLTADNVLVIGHGRRLAAMKLGCEMPYHRVNKNAEDLTDEDIRELRLADNETNRETGYDLETLNLEIGDLEFDGFDFDFPGNQNESDVMDEKHDKLTDRYLVPPFSVLYGNKAEWLNRKRMWVNFGIHSEIGRGGQLVFQFPAWMDRQAKHEGGVS